MTTAVKHRIAKAQRRRVSLRKNRAAATAPATPKTAPAITISGPITFPPVIVMASRSPLFPGVDLQAQLQISAQLVPAETAQPAQLTLPAQLGQTIVNWGVANPEQALNVLLWGLAGLTLFAIAAAATEDTARSRYKR